MLKFLFTGIIAAVLSLVVYLCLHLGVFLPVSTEVTSKGPFYMLYQNHTGAYHQIGLKLQAVESFATANNLLCLQTFGEFLDDPSSVDQDRLRSRAGCLLSAKPEHIPSPFLFEERPTTRYLIGQFSGSPSISPWKVYPKLNEYAETHRLKILNTAIEIYQVSGKNVKIEVLLKLAN